MVILFTIHHHLGGGYFISSKDCILYSVGIKRISDFVG